MTIHHNVNLVESHKHKEVHENLFGKKLPVYFKDLFRTSLPVILSANLLRLRNIHLKPFILTLLHRI